MPTENSFLLYHVTSREAADLRAHQCSSLLYHKMKKVGTFLFLLFSLSLAIGAGIGV